MTILSSLFLLNNTKSIWQLVCKEPAGSIYNCRNLKYSPVYKGYVGVDNTQLTFSSDLKTWKTISAYSHGTPFYCEADGYFYCIKISKVSNKAQVALKKMTAWNVFSSAIIVDTSEENTSYLSSHNGGLYKLGNYYALPYTFDWSDINQHKIAFTQNFQTWNVIEYYRGTGTSSSQMVSLGCSGTQLVVFAGTDNGFCPTIFKSPTEYEILSPLWTGGNMTGATGFYLNGAWYYQNMSWTEYKSTDGRNFTKLARPSETWLSQNTIFYKQKYISVYKKIIRCASDDLFSDYTEVDTSADIGAVCLSGIVNDELYVVGNDDVIYKTEIENILG